MIRRQAADWVARLRGDPTGEVRARFRRWYDTDPRHSEAFDRIQQHFDRDFGLLRSSPVAARRSLTAAANVNLPQGRRALAAVLGAILLVSAALLVMEAGGLLSTRAQAMTLRTGVGEIRKVVLADGSTLTLDTQSTVSVDFGRDRRSARLEQGRARFAIKPSRRPFIVSAGPVEIRSEAAIVDVRREPGGSRVEVRSGAVEVEGDGPAPSRLAAGRGLAPAGASGRRAYLLSGRGTWPSGMLEFDSTPLGEAAAEASRYSDRHLIVADRSLAGLRISGAFRAGDVEGLARTLAGAFRLEIARTPSGDLRLERQAGAPHENGTGNP
jgi:transmembrane sensor